MIGFGGRKVISTCVQPMGHCGILGAGSSAASLTHRDWDFPPRTRPSGMTAKSALFSSSIALRARYRVLAIWTAIVVKEPRSIFVGGDP